VHDDKRRAIRVRNHRRGFDRLVVNDLQEIVVDLVQAGIFDGSTCELLMSSD